MPLPASETSDNQQLWPPSDLADVYAKYSEWAAWYSGDAERLRDFYASAASGQARGWWRFWARIGQRPGAQKAQLHVPIAGDLAAVSGALLFGEEPNIHIREAMAPDAGDAESAVEDRLQRIIIEGGAYNRLIEGAESAAAMSGVFLYPAWDKDLFPVPLVNVAQADNAVPVFQFGVLKSVVFHEIVDQEGQQVKRHLELHEPGRIEHAVYVGTKTHLGRRLPDQAVLAIGLDPVITLPFPELDVEYVPNMLPNRLWRQSSLGISDYSGSEGLFDALDEVYASLMRDIRLAKSRIIVPRDFLNDSGDLDIDHEVYQPMDMEPGAAEAGARAMLAQQFQIRYEEHIATATELVERIVSNAGYSPQTFGMRVEGRAESGTALRIREAKTMLTLKRKSNFWRPALQRLFTHLLIIDSEVFAGPGVTGLNVEAELNDGIPVDVTEMARAAAQLNAAQAASIETRVRLVNPHKDNEWIKAEVQRITDETAKTTGGARGGDPGADPAGMTMDVNPQTGEAAARSERAVAFDNGQTAAERGKV